MLSSCPQGPYSLSSQFTKMTNDHNHWGLNYLDSYKVKVLPSRVVVAFSTRNIHIYSINTWIICIKRKGISGMKILQSPEKFGSSNGKDFTVSLAPLQAAVLEEATFLWSRSIVSQIVSRRSVTPVLTSCIPVTILAACSLVCLRHSDLPVLCPPEDQLLISYPCISPTHGSIEDPVSLFGRHHSWC